MLKRKLLKKDTVEDFDHYSCESFNYLFDLLKDNDFYLSNSLKELKSIMPNIDKAIWYYLALYGNFSLLVFPPRPFTSLPSCFVVLVPICVLIVVPPGPRVDRVKKCRG